MNFMRVSLLLLIVFFMGGCYPDSEISPEESDTVQTSYLPGTNFSKFTYYKMPDSVLRSGNYIYSKGPYDDLILQKIDVNLKARGYQRLLAQDTTTADFYIIVSDLSFISISYYWNYIPYWYYYPDYYFPFDDNGNYYDAYFSLAPPSSVSWFPQSNFMVDMVENRLISEDGNLPIYWRGITTGVMDTGMQDRLARNIDQMFFQSPYLKTY